MEAYGRRGRFTRFYSDNKAIKLDEFPNTPPSEQHQHQQQQQQQQQREGDPELAALHAEFKIQRERLAAWGREWGDDRVLSSGGRQDEYWEDGARDERAELKSTVQDVLEYVRNVLDESERISHGGLASMTTVGEGGEKKKKSIPQWKMDVAAAEQKWTLADRSRYEQLASELKESIDLLYDISKTRKESKGPVYLGSAGKSKMERNIPPPVSKSVYSTSSYNTSEETLVSFPRTSTQRTETTTTSSSFDLPPRLDLSSLDLPAEEPPPYESAGATPATRMIAHYRLPAPPSQSSDEDGGSLLLPVLVEYAPFDASYRSTEVQVPTNRLDSLMGFYARCSTMADFPQYGTLSCLGYFEDPKQARYGLVYELPKKALHLEKLNGASIDSRPVSLQKVLQQASRSLNTNSRQVAPGPPLEDRFRLAYNLIRAFSKLHLEERILHKDVNSSNIIFFLKPLTGESKSYEYDLRAPYISSFDLFSEYNIEEPAVTVGRNLYRHPHDPKIFGDKCEFCESRSCRCGKSRFDIYGLGLVLLEIGLWIPISDVFKHKYSLEDFRKRVENIWVRKLASRCGSVYQTIVKECLQQASQNATEEQMRANYDRWLGKMRRCCALDEQEESPPPTTPARASSISGAAQTNSPESSFVASDAAGAAQTASPFMALNTMPTSSWNPFSRFASKRTQIPFSIAEEDNHLFSQKGYTFNDFARNRDMETLSRSSTPTIAHVRAASIIQKAWRNHQSQSAFIEYKRKVSLIQRTWRKSQESRKAMSPPRNKEDVRIEAETVSDYAQFQVTQHHSTPKPKLRIQPVKLTQEHLDEWHDRMLPKIERICEKCLRDSPETITIDLLAVGETALTARPTIFITCTSTARVRGAITRRFQYDHNQFDLKVRRGRVRRSKASRSKRHGPAHRSMMSDDYSTSGDAPLNPFYQTRPICGASIGAYIGDKHLPPVSYGGVVDVDGEPFGMTVHHLLDTPSDVDDSDFDEDEVYAGAERSSARRTDGFNPMLAGIAGHPTLQSIPTDSIFPLEISDDEELLSSGDEDAQEFGYSDFEEEYLTSDYESENESIEIANSKWTLGDQEGVIPGDGEEIVVTQPALDDVDDDFFPDEEDKDDDHLASHKLGHIHASSGIRRWNREGNDGRNITHEIDWALLKLDASRLQPYNLVQGGRKHLRNPVHHDIRTPLLLEKFVEPICRGANYTKDDDEFPIRVARSEELGGLRVHCFGRTSGLQTGIVGMAMSSVRIYKRRSFSRSWHVQGAFGRGGDSGAWVIDNDQGRVCGHVLAWCERNLIAYICPMEVMLDDIKRTLGARSICLPGGEDDIIPPEACPQYSKRDSARQHQHRVGDKKRLDLPDIARLDLADRERLGLRGGEAEQIMRRSAAKEVMGKVSAVTAAAAAAAAATTPGSGAPGRTTPTTVNGMSRRTEVDLRVS